MNNRQRLIQRYLMLLQPLPTEYLIEKDTTELTATIFSYFGNKTNLKVQSKVEDILDTTDSNSYTTKEIEATCFNYSNVENVVIPDGVTTIY